MFKEQKMISCIFTVVVLLLGLTTFGNGMTVVTPFVDDENPDPIINGSVEETVDLGGVTVNNNEMDASTCNFTILSESLLLRCFLGYQVSYTYNKDGTDFIFSGPTDTGISEIIPATGEMLECVTDAKDGVDEPNIAAIFEKCPDVAQQFSDPKKTSISFPCVAGNEDGTFIPNLAVKIDLFTIQGRRVLDLI